MAEHAVPSWAPWPPETERTFEPWPKIGRLSTPIIITEKIDGTNAAVVISDDYDIYAQSRKRLITPEHDNYGFARWVEDHKETLLDNLGPGRHFGEWWGSGIGRGYDLPKGAKRFSLFNVKRWDLVDLAFAGMVDIGVNVVPIVAELNQFDTNGIDYALDNLRQFGSYAAPGFMRPEGVVVYHVATRVMFKKLLEHDDLPKSVVARMEEAA